MATIKLALFSLLLVTHAFANDHAVKKNQKNQNKNASKHGQLAQLLSDYDKTMLPSAFGGNEGLPTPVTVNLLIRDGSVNEEHEEFSTTVTLRMNWTDSRLAYQGSSSHPYLPVHDGHSLWTPDIFFKDEKRAHFHHVLTPNILYKIYPDGTVSMSTRLSLVLGCPINTKWFPFDHQQCHIRLASYTHTTSEVTLSWRDNEPVQKFNFTTRKYHLERIEAKNTTDYTPTGDYNMLTVNLSFRRVMCSYITQYFLPTTLLVIITWFAFWLHPDIVTPRILLGLVSLVTIHQMQTDGAVTSLFGTALGVWGQFCSMMIVLSVFETVLVNYWNRCDTETYKNCKEFDDGSNGSPLGTPLLTAAMFALPRKGMMPIRRGDRVDAISRCTFPLIFVVFSAVYWAVCLS